jgi:hypothetical protein
MQFYGFLLVGSFFCTPFTVATALCRRVLQKSVRQDTMPGPVHASTERGS